MDALLKCFVFGVGTDLIPRWNLGRRYLYDFAVCWYLRIGSDLGACLFINASVGEGECKDVNKWYGDSNGFWCDEFDGKFGCAGGVWIEFGCIRGCVCEAKVNGDTEFGVG